MRLHVLFFSLCILLCMHHVASITYSPLTTISFSRRLDTCDRLKDQALTAGTTHLIYSYSTEHPTNDSAIHRHRGHGTRSVRLLEVDPTPSKLPVDSATFNLAANNLSVPFFPEQPDTMYFCQVKQLPTVTSKHHIIRVEPYVSPPENVEFLHHMVVYVCDAHRFNQSFIDWQGPCDSSPDPIQACLALGVLHAWAVGGGIYDYLPKMGLPFGTSDGPKIVVLQTHYNNQRRVPVVDSSGLTFTYTSQLRQYDAAIFYQGQDNTPWFTIPANVTHYPYSPWCPGQAIAAMFPQKVNVVAAFLHAHLAGRKISLRQFRNGIELPPILTDSYYDFNFQDFEVLAQERELWPGDVIMTTCEYDTTDRNFTTIFGESTKNEMCVSFLSYYPASPLGTGCFGGNFTGQFAFDYAVSYGNNSFLANLPPLNVTSYYQPPNCTHEDPATFSPFASKEPSILPLSAFDPTVYTRSLQLDVNYMLYWHVNLTEQSIDFAVQVNNSKGWAGLGFSPVGSMLNSDVMIAWLEDCSARDADSTVIYPDCTSDNLKGHLKDRFASQHALPDIDPWQDFYNVVFYTDRVQTAAPDDRDSKYLGLSKVSWVIIGSVALVVFLIVGALCLKRGKKKGPAYSHVAELSDGMANPIIYYT